MTVPGPTPALRVLSLGAGVQSTTLALLAVEGVLPKPDAATFIEWPRSSRPKKATSDHYVSRRREAAQERK